MQIFDEEVNPPMRMLQEFQASIEEIHDLLEEQVHRLRDCSNAQLVAR